MRGRARYIAEEPCCVGLDTAEELLRGIGWEKSADLVRDIGKRDKERNADAMKWKAAYERVLQRLHRYEPPAQPAAAVSYKPPPEADG